MACACKPWKLYGLGSAPHISSVSAQCLGVYSPGSGLYLGAVPHMGRCVWGGGHYARKPGIIVLSRTFNGFIFGTSFVTPPSVLRAAHCWCYWAVLRPQPILHTNRAVSTKHPAVNVCWLMLLRLPSLVTPFLGVPLWNYKSVKSSEATTWNHF
jgi:hypothetical protein